jgi:peptidoglycan biosynthesis protein MviN/MurJ (putative lipid II flippase)
MIAALIQRGAFLPSDTAAVSGLWRIYLISMAAGCLGSVTGRAFYALKQTRTIAAVGVVEALAYAAYTPWLAARLSSGVAAGYVVFITVDRVVLPLLRWNWVDAGESCWVARSSALALLCCWAASPRVQLPRFQTA